MSVKRTPKRLALLGERLRDSRILRRWTLDDAARETGVTRAIIQSIEVGHHQHPPAEVLARLCKEYALSTPKVLTEAGYHELARLITPSTQFSGLQLTANERRIVLAMVSALRQQKTNTK